MLATDRSWTPTGNASNDWNNTGNWTGGANPANNDRGFITNNSASANQTNISYRNGNWQMFGAANIGIVVSNSNTAGNNGINKFLLNSGFFEMQGMVVGNNGIVEIGNNASLATYSQATLGSGGTIQLTGNSLWRLGGEATAGLTVNGNLVGSAGAGNTATFDGNATGGGGDSFVIIASGGRIIANSGTLYVSPDDAFSNDGMTINSGGTLQINSGATFILNRTINAWDNDSNPDNAGTIFMNGGTFTTFRNNAFNNTMTIDNNSGGIIVGNGTFNSTLINNGTVIATNGTLTLTNVSGNGGTWVAKSEAGGGTLMFQRTVDLGGGSMFITNATIQLSQGSVQNTLTLATSFRNNNGTLLYGNSGSGGSTFTMANVGGLSAFTNSATVAGRGTFITGFGAGQNNNAFVNNGTIVASGGSAGTLTIDVGDTSAASGFSNTAAGVIIITNGTTFGVIRTANAWNNNGNVNTLGTMILSNGAFAAKDGSGTSVTRLIINGGTITSLGTSAQVTNFWRASMENRGSIYITNASTFHILGDKALTNTASGQIFLGTNNASATLIATNIGDNGNALVNLGLIQGQGTITLGVTNDARAGGSSGNFINSGILNATNWNSAGAGTLFISVGNAFSNGGFSNTAAGTILIASNTTLTVNRTQNAWAGSGNSVANLGTISLAGGSLNLASDGILSNAASFINSGTISGWGTIDSVVITTNGGKVFANTTNLTGVGTLTLRVASTTNNSTSTLGTIGTNAVLNLLAPGGQNTLINFGTISLSGGTINFGGGSGTITNFFIVAGVGNLSTFDIVNTGATASIVAQAPIAGLSNLIAGVNVTNVALLGANNLIGGAATLNLDTSTGGGLVNNGTILLQGGFITVTNSSLADAGMTNLTGIILGYGTNLARVANLSGGTIMASNGVLVLGVENNLNLGTFTNFNSSSSIQLTNSILVNQGKIFLNGGGLRLTGSTITNGVDGAGGTITGPGDISSSLYNYTNGLVNATNGVLNIATNAGESVVNLGTFDISSGSTLSNGPSAWNNTNGFVRLNAGTLTGGTVTNKGTISGNGTVMSTVVNAAEGTVRATNGVLNLRSTTISQSGTMIGGTAAGTYIQATNLSGFFNNNGTMILDGNGNVAYYILGDFSNAVGGVISGAGILRTADGVVGGGGANFNIRNMGRIFATNGTLAVDSGDGFSFGFNNGASATVDVANAATFAIARSTNAWLNALNPVNNGVMILKGGTVSAFTNVNTGPTGTFGNLGTTGGKSDIASISNAVNGTIQGFGTWNPRIINLGTVVATNGTLTLANTASLTMSGTFQVQNNATLDVRADSGTLFTSGQLQLFGGTMWATGAITQVRVTSTGSIVGFGQVMTSTNTGGAGGNEFIISGGTVIATNGTLYLNSGNAFNAGGLSNSASGEIRVANGATFTFNRTATSWNNSGANPDNFGLVNLQGGTFVLAADGANDNARFVNNRGTISGQGTFSGSVTNSGWIVATNGTLIVSGAGRFSQTGTLSIEQGGTLLLSNTVAGAATTFSNAGTILMRGGTLLAGTITNATTIQGYGTIEGGGVANGGTLLANATNLTTAGTLTVRLSSFTNVAAATLGVIGTNTVLDVLTPGNNAFLINQGTINLSAGRITNSLASSFTISNFFVIAGVGDLSSLPVVNSGPNASIIAQNPTQGISNFFASVVVTNSAILGANNVGGAATLSLTVGNGAQGLVNNGTIALQGGFISINGGASEVTNLTGQIYGSGLQSNLNVANLSGGSVVASNGTLRFGAVNNLNQGLYSNFNASSTLRLTNSILVNATGARIKLNGGGLVMGGSVITNQGTISGPGDISASIYNDTGGFVAATNSGVLNIATNSGESVVNLGTFDISSGSTLSNGPSAWNNTNGTVRLNAGTLTGGIVTNKGTITGNGTIMSVVVNAAEGTVRATNGVLDLRATTISQSGTMIGGTAAGTYLQVTNLSGFFNNSGTMVLDGSGNLAYYLLNNFSNTTAGVIRGAGILRTGDDVPGGNNFTIRNMGLIQATNGTLIVDSGDAFGFGFNNGISGTVDVANASTFGIARTTNAWVNATTNPVNNGAIILHGGIVQTYTNNGTGTAATPVADSRRIISNSVTGVISGNGSLNLNLINLGLVDATNGTLFLSGTAAFANGGTIAVENNATFTTLQNTGSFVNNGTIQLFGGTFVGTNMTQFRSSGGNISGYGTLHTGKTSGSGGANAEIVNTASSLILATNGSLFVDPGDAFAAGGLSNSATSTIRVADGASFILNRTANAWDNSVGSGFDNPHNLGTINLQGGSWSNYSDGVASSAKFVENYGTIIGRGTFSGSITNLGTIAPTNGMLTVDGTGKFRQAGTLSIDVSGILRLTNSAGSVGISFTNEASILMRGGELQAGVIANTNVIFGFGTISGAGIQNSGAIYASNGTLVAGLSSFTNITTAILGTLSTNATLDVTVPGGAGQPLINQGTISLAGGTLLFNGTSSGTISNRTTGTVIGVGEVTQTVINNGTIMAANPVSGLSIFSVGMSDLNSATIGASNGATLNVVLSGGSGSSFNNNGSITMLGGTLIISNGAPGIITNNSMITGVGTIVPAIVNLKTNAATVNGGTLDITLFGGTNKSSGYLLAGVGAVLQVQNNLVNLGTMAANGANGGTIQIAQASGVITNLGTILSSGNLTFNSFVHNANGGFIAVTNGVLTFNSVGGLYNTGVVNVANGGTLQSNSSNSWSNAGTIDMRGGTIRTGGFTNTVTSAIFSNSTSGFINGYGTLIGGGAYNLSPGSGVDKTIANLGTILVTNPLSATAATLTIDTGAASAGGGIQNLGNIIISSNNTLVLSRQTGLPILNTGTITINNGTLTGSGVLSNTSGGIIQGYGTLSHPIVNLSGGTIRATNGLLTMTSTVFPVNEGTFEIDNNSTMTWNTSNSWRNAGTVDLRGGTLRTGGATNAATTAVFTNTITGLIQGWGTLFGGGAFNTNGIGIDKSFVNEGFVIASNGVLTIDTGVSVTNRGLANLGTMIVKSTNDTLVLSRHAEITGSPSFVTNLNYLYNSGTILIHGGTLTSTTAITNQFESLSLPGLIQGFGHIFLTNELANLGTIRSTNDVVGGDGIMHFVSGASSLRISQRGTLDVELGSQMIFGTSSNSPFANAGTILMDGGILRSGSLTNLLGATFRGFGTITSPTIINAGTGMATSLSQVLHLTGTGLINTNSGVFGGQNGKLIVDGVFTNAGKVSFLNSIGTFNADVVNRGAWVMDPSTNVYFGNFTVATNGYITMTAGDVSIFKSNFYNSSHLSNQYDTVNGKFIFNGDDGLPGTYTQLFYVAGLDIGGTNLVPVGTPSRTNAFVGSIGTPIFGFTNNFALGTLQIGSLNSTSTLTLLDTFGALEPSDGNVAALYVNTLTINPGSLLIISNNVELYFKTTNGVTGISFGTLNPGDNVLLLNPNSSFHQLIVPEPSILMMLVVGGVGLYWRRRRKKQAPGV